MLFINISSDQVQLIDNNQKKFLPRNGIEHTFGPLLLDIARDADAILLLNGPGGFTNLRVGTLVLNAFNTLIHHDTGKFISLFSITKLALYTYAYKKGWLPRYGILYIGQKHNVWKYDAQEEIYQQIILEEIHYSDQLFLDFVYDPYWEKNDEMVSFSMENNQLCLHYGEKTYQIPFEELHLIASMTVKPEYLIQPTMN